MYSEMFFGIIMFIVMMIILLLFQDWVLEKRRTAGWKRENIMLTHMFDQITNRISTRLLKKKEQKISKDQDAVQRGLIQFREKFSEGISDDVYKFLECLVQLAFNAGGPAAALKKADDYQNVDKEVYYDRLMDILKTVMNPTDFEEAVIAFQWKAKSLKKMKI